MKVTKMRSNYEMCWRGGLRNMIKYNMTFHLLPHELWVLLQKRKARYDFEAENLNLLKLFGKINFFCRTRNVGSKRKRCEPRNFQEWK